MFNLRTLPPVVKNLLLLNILVFVCANLPIFQFLNQYFPLYYFQSNNFYVFQYITCMFMHGGIAHLFFNMFALFMFGSTLERVWGGQRFLLYYLATGFGASLFYHFVLWIQYSGMFHAAEVLQQNMTLDNFEFFVNKYFANEVRQDMLQGFLNSWEAKGANSLEGVRAAQESVKELIQGRINVPMVGASGAIFGLLLAFGMLFPNTELMMLFLPIPIKAKYFVVLYGVIELILGLSGTHTGVAHFAHLGGMLFGLLLILYWRRRSNTY